jgi:hypothetical protein
MRQVEHVSCMGDMRSAIVILVTMEVTIFSDVRLRSVANMYLAAGSSKISACIYQTAWYHNPDVIFMHRRYEKSKQNFGQKTGRKRF